VRGRPGQSRQAVQCVRSPYIGHGWHLQTGLGRARFRRWNPVVSMLFQSSPAGRPRECTQWRGCAHGLDFALVLAPPRVHQWGVCSQSLGPSSRRTGSYDDSFVHSSFALSLALDLGSPQANRYVRPPAHLLASNLYCYVGQLRGRSKSQRAHRGR
jgi:hypothetical protein